MRCAVFSAEFHSRCMSLRMLTKRGCLEILSQSSSLRLCSRITSATGKISCAISRASVAKSTREESSAAVFFGIAPLDVLLRGDLAVLVEIAGEALTERAATRRHRLLGVLIGGADAYRLVDDQERFLELRLGDSNEALVGKSRHGEVIQLLVNYVFEINETRGDL